MNGENDDSSYSQCHFEEIWKNIRILSGVIVMMSMAGLTSGQTAHAGPLVSALFGNDTCTFLPDGPAPGWVNKRPNTTDYVGVGSAPRMPNPTDQIQAAEQSARTALAAEIEVAIQETMTIVIEEKNRTTSTRTDHDSNQQIILAGKQTVEQTLMGSRIDEKWLDRENCIVHVVATATQASVEEARKKLAERLRKLFKFKNLMLLDRSEIQGEVISVMRGQLEGLFKGVGNRLLTADNGHSVCADNPGQPACQQPTDTIYAGYKMVLEKEAATPEFKRRIYKLTGNVRFKDRLIASFDVSCQGTGKVSQDYLIDQQAAKSCFEKTKPMIEQGMEGSE